MRPITFNAQLGYCDRAQLVRDAKAAEVGSILAYIDNLSHLLYILELQRELPDTLIITRCWHPDDFRFHELGHDLSENGESYVTSPETFLRTFGELGRNGRVLNVLNEPHGYVNIDRLVGWLIQLIEICPVDIRLALPAFATGHPASEGGRDTEWDRRYDPLILLMAQHPRHLWNIHEYWPGKGYRVGRFVQLLTSCQRLGVKCNPIFISEWGTDAADSKDPLNGWRSRGLTEHAYFSLLDSLYHEIYRPYVLNGTIIGIAIFCYGNSGGWHDFRVDNARTFVSLLVQYGPKDNVKMTQTIKWQNFDWGAEIPNQRAELDYKINVRSEPNSRSEDVGDLANGDVVTLWANVLEKDNPLNPDKTYRWFKINLPGVGICYVAQVGGLKFSPVAVVPAPSPPDSIPGNITEADNLREIFKGIEVGADRAIAGLTETVSGLEVVREYAIKMQHWLDDFMDRNGDPD